MPFEHHPAFPTAADLTRERAAALRDRAGIATLAEWRVAISHALDRVSRCDDLHHPDRRFCLEDLTEALQGTLADIDGEAQRIRRSPVVIEAE
jgi:hypothetical protein